MEYILGTANLGLVYGITNPKEYNFRNSRLVIQTALDNQIDHFDTAPNYGLAESALGEFCSPTNNISVTTKISKQEKYSVKEVLKSLNESIKTLGLKQLESILFHDSKIYLQPNFNELVEVILETKKVKRVGVSIYSKDEILRTIDKSSKICEFQVPENILDRRLFQDNDLLNLHNNGFIFNVRSIFLQGLLLANRNLIRAKFPNYVQNFDNLFDYAKRNDQEVIDLCLSYIDSINWRNKTLISIQNPNHIKKILNFKKIPLDLGKLDTLPLEILDPRNWANT